MKLTKKTLTRDILPILNSERYERIIAAVPPVSLKKRIVHCTIGEFCEMTEDGYEERLLLSSRRALTAFGRVRTYREEIEEIASFFKSVIVEQTAEEKSARSGIRFPDFQQSLLVGVMRDFHLTALERPKGVRGMFVRSAADVPLAEYMVVLKAKAADENYSRKYAAVMDAKNRRNAK